MAGHCKKPISADSDQLIMQLTFPVCLNACSMRLKDRCCSEDGVVKWSAGHADMFDWCSLNQPEKGMQTNSQVLNTMTTIQVSRDLLSVYKKLGTGTVYGTTHATPGLFIYMLHSQSSETCKCTPAHDL